MLRDTRVTHLRDRTLSTAARISSPERGDVRDEARSADGDGGGVVVPRLDVAGGQRQVERQRAERVGDAELDRADLDALVGRRSRRRTAIAARHPPIGRRRRRRPGRRRRRRSLTACTSSAQIARRASTIDGGRSATTITGAQARLSDLRRRASGRAAWSSTLNDTTGPGSLRANMRSRRSGGT